MAYDKEKLSFIQELKNVKDILIIGQFYNRSQTNILMYAHVAPSEEIAQKGKIMRNNHTRLINIQNDAQKTMEPSYTAMGSANNFMVAGNGAHVAKALSIIDSYGLLLRQEPTALNIAELTFNSYVPYNDNLNNQLYLNTFFPNNPTTPRILGMVFEPSGHSGRKQTAMFGILSEDKKIIDIVSTKGAEKRTYIDVPICERSGKLLATFYDSNKTSELIDFKMPDFMHDQNNDIVQKELSDLVLKMLGPNAIGVASKCGYNHESYVIQKH